MAVSLDQKVQKAMLEAMIAVPAPERIEPYAQGVVAFPSDGTASTVVKRTVSAPHERFFEKPKFPVYAPTFPTTDYHVSYEAQDAIRANDGKHYEYQLSTAVKWCAARNLKLVAMHEWDGPPICSDREAMFNAKIARLEAENESLSRQLRSRTINAEPVAPGKAWRWSPLV